MNLYGNSSYHSLVLSGSPAGQDREYGSLTLLPSSPALSIFRPGLSAKTVGIGIGLGFSGSISGSVLSGSLGQKESSSPVTLSSVASSTTRQTAVGDSHLASIFTWKKRFFFRFSGAIISYVTSVSFVDGIWTLPFC